MQGCVSRTPVPLGRVSFVFILRIPYSGGISVLGIIEGDLAKRGASYLRGGRIIYGGVSTNASMEVYLAVTVPVSWVYTH